MKAKHTTREEWLMSAVGLLTKQFEEKGYKVPKNLRVSCGFPSIGAFASRLQRVGECWSDHCSKGKVFEIFISPVLDKPSGVLDTLLHEVVHAVVGLKCGHRHPFRLCATAMGLEGAMRSTVAGAELKKRLNTLAETLGKYPHEQISKLTNARTRQGTRLLKVACPDCGYTVRVTAKWIEQGYPTCPCGTEMEGK